MSAVLQNPRISLPGEARSVRPAGGQTLKGKLYALIALAVLVVIAVQAWSIYKERELMLDTKRGEISSVVEGATSLVDYFYQLQKQGKMDQQAAQTAAKTALQGFRYGGKDGKSEYVLIIDAANGIMLMHGANPGFAGTNSVANIGNNGDPAAAMKGRLDAIKAGGGQAYAQVSFVPAGETVAKPKLNVYMLHQPWGWVVGTGVFVDDLGEAVTQRIMASVGITIAVAILLLIAGTLIVRSVAGQIGGEPGRIIEIMRRMAHGDLSEAIPAAAPGSLLAGLATMSSSVRELISKVRDEAGAMKRDAQRVADTVGQISTATNRQSDATSSMAAAVEELTVSIAHISDAATQTQRNSEGVADKCRDGETRVMSAADSMKRIASAVGEASKKIRGLEERAVQINSIAASIKEIAGQTNLLALNAAIEAARAGEQGRGFSVVADEVRKLAERTSSATVEIEEMVSAVQRETSESTVTMGHILPMVSEGTELADQVAVSLREISHSADTSLERVREVAHATKEQSAASTSIAQQVESIAQMVEETTVAMGETARSAQEMHEMAERLDKLVGTFKV